MPSAPTVDLGDTRTPIGYRTFCADVNVNYQCNRWAEWIGTAAIEPLTRLGARADGLPAWVDGMLGLAEQARSDGDGLAAAYLDRGAEFFMRPADPRRAGARRRFVTTLRQTYGAVVEQVPYLGARLPAYDLRPTTQRGEPIVVFGGFDSYIEEFFPLLYAWVAQGRRVVAFDGPGQGGALDDAGLAMTPDWAPCVAAVLDHFELGSVTAVGISLGGALVMRAAADEPRIARAVAFDVCDDQLDTATDRLGAAGRALRALLRLRARRLINLLSGSAASRQPSLGWSLQQGMRVTGTSTPYDFLRAAAQTETASVSGRIRSDVLLLAGADDHLIPRRMLARQAATLTSARSVTTRLFTADEQASSHCQVGNIGLAGHVIDAWIAHHEADTRSDGARQP